MPKPTWRPLRVRNGRIQQQRVGHTKKRWVDAEECETCAPARAAVPAHLAYTFTSVCGDATCFMGWRAKSNAPACCCSLPPEDRCRGCAEAYGLIHVCTVETDEELEYELRMAMMPSQRAEISDEARERAAAMEQNMRMGQ